MIDYILNFIQSNPLLTCLALFWIYRIYQSQKPFPKVEGSKVKSISSMPEFEQALLEGKKEGKRVLCDFMQPGARRVRWLHQFMVGGQKNIQMLCF